MTHCIGRPADELFESYLQGTLPEAEAQGFEEHYFDCPVCLAQVEALQAVALTLASQPRVATKKVIAWPLRVGIGGAIAATILISLVSVQMKRSTARSPIANAPQTASTPSKPASHPQSSTMTSRAVAQLADLTLPTFQAPHVRGESGDTHFEAGMHAYTSQDCPLAVKALSQVSAQNADALAARFYSGVCQMKDSQLSAASQTLQGVADAGDSPQQEAALYYLAQIALAHNDATMARHYLARTIQLRGDFEARSRAELIRFPR